MFNELDKLMHAKMLDQRKLADWAMRMHTFLKEELDDLAPYAQRTNMNETARRLQLSAWALDFYRNMTEK